MSSNLSKTLKTKIQKSARHIQRDSNVNYSQALELAAQQAGFSSYHALQATKRNNNHQSDIVNPNLGTNGVNDAYAKAMGNRGKQLNPNQKHSFVFSVDPRAKVSQITVKNGLRYQTATAELKDGYVQKIFVEGHGGRILSKEEVVARGFTEWDRQTWPVYRSQCTVHSLFIEFLSDTLWEYEAAVDLICSCFFPSSDEYSISAFFCSDIIWLNGKIRLNWNYDFERYELPDYHPAIDGY